MSLVPLSVRNIGPIKEAEVKFGDLTVLVGPQASGKSIFLQLLKLAIDSGAVLDILKDYGLNWRSGVSEFLNIYLGEGMGDVWNSDSELAFKGHALQLSNLVKRQKPNKDEQCFFIPAQRVLTWHNGWPRPFSDYGAQDPFVVRDFSEKTRSLMETSFGADDDLFPQARRIKSELRQELSNTIFQGFRVSVDRVRPQKRLVLKKDGRELPYMVWSAGQREFVPLLLGLYWLLPPTKVSLRDEIKWVVIEELEMGLHPRAISSVILIVLELLQRGYRVCLSTHSPRVLDVIWALNVARACRATPGKVLDLFGVEHKGPMMEIARAALQKDLKVFYFDTQTGKAQDISDLDPSSQNKNEAGWGGLTEFSSHVTDLVADMVADHERTSQ